MEIDFSNVEFRHEVHRNEDDEIYIGQFIVGTNIKQGRGAMLTADKDLYEGYWVNNQKCGKGRMVKSFLKTITSMKLFLSIDKTKSQPNITTSV